MKFFIFGIKKDIPIIQSFWRKIKMFTITKIKEYEIDLLLEFIKKLALYEERLDQVTATPKDLRYYIFDKKTCEAIFLREDNQVIGFALYFL